MIYSPGESVKNIVNAALIHRIIRLSLSAKTSSGKLLRAIKEIEILAISARNAMVFSSHEKNPWGYQCVILRQTDTFPAAEEADVIVAAEVVTLWPDMSTRFCWCCSKFACWMQCQCLQRKWCWSQETMKLVAAALSGWSYILIT